MMRDYWYLLLTYRDGLVKLRHLLMIDETYARRRALYKQLLDWSGLLNAPEIESKCGFGVDLRGAGGYATYRQKSVVETDRRCRSVYVQPIIGQFVLSSLS